MSTFATLTAILPRPQKLQRGVGAWGQCAAAAREARAEAGRISHAPAPVAPEDEQISIKIHDRAVLGEIPDLWYTQIYVVRFQTCGTRQGSLRKSCSSPAHAI